MYQGPREQLLPYFELAGHVCPPLFNPSDFCIDLISVDVRGQTRQEKTTARVHALIAFWKSHRQVLTNESPANNGGEDAILEDRPERTPMYIALPVVLGRTFRNTWRQPDLFWTRWTQAPVVAFFFFIFFLRLHHGPTGGQDRIGLVAQASSSFPFVGFLVLAAQYPKEKAIFFHDYKSAGGCYSSATFVVALSLFAFIPEFVSALLVAVILNVATGMRTDARIFFEFTVATWVQLSFGESVGIAFASFFDTMGLSVSLVSVFLSISAQASSVFSASVVPWLLDIAWIFPMKYAARIQLINEMKGMVFDCSPEAITNGACTAATGDQVLDLFGIHDAPWKLLLVSIVVTVGYRVIAWGILSIRRVFTLCSVPRRH